MAVVKVLGPVVSKKHLPSKNGNPAQFAVTVNDGARFGMFVPVDSVLAGSDVGDYVSVEGTLQVRRSGEYTNLNVVDITSVECFDLVPAKG